MVIGILEMVKNGYFDYNYCWDFQEKVLKHLANDSVPDLAGLREACDLLANQGLTAGEAAAPEDTITNPYAGRSRMVYILNHDVLQDQGGSGDIVYKEFLVPLTVLEFTVYGMPLIYNGQEIAYKSGGRVSLAEKTPIDWNQADTTMTNLIKTLAHLKHTQPALRTGEQSGKLTNLTTTADDAVYAYMRTSGDNNVVVTLNLSDREQTFSIPDGLPEGVFKEALNGKTDELSADTELTLPPFGAAVYVRR